MIASTHLAVGAVSGLLVQKYLPPSYGLIERIGAGFLLGVISHILTDAPLHKEYSFEGHKLAVTVATEILVVFAVVLYPFQITFLSSVIFSGMIGGALPDFISISYNNGFKWRWLGNIDRAIHFFHGKIPLGFQMGLGWQVILAIIAIIFVRLAR